MFATEQLDAALKQLSALQVDVMSLKSQVTAADQRAEKASQADTEFLATLRSKVRRHQCHYAARASE